MTAMIRPSLILQMNLDERLNSDDAVPEIKRSYSYVAPSVVAFHEPADEARVENVMRYMVKLHRPYWDKNDPAAEELWQGVMPKWLHNMFAKVSNTITASNKVHAKAGEPGTTYAWMEVEFGENALLAIKTTSDSAMPEEGVAFVERAREALVDGAFGGGVACVRIPSRESYEAQLAKAQEADAEAAAQAADAEATPDAPAGVEADEDGSVPVDAPAEADESASVASEGADEGAAEEAERFVEPVLPAFDVDYTIWGIEYADGSARAFDAAAGEFVRA